MQSNMSSYAHFSSAHHDPPLVSSSVLLSQEFSFLSQALTWSTPTKGTSGYQFLGAQAFLHPLKLASSAEFPSLEGLSYMMQENVYEDNHGEALRMHLLLCFLGLEALLGNHLVPMFIKCRNLPYALQTFYKIAEPNVYSWTSLINGYVNTAEFQCALDLFQNMQDCGLQASTVTLLAVVKACGRLKLLQMGYEIHMKLVKSGYEDDSFLSSTVVDMYSRCGSLVEAQVVFDKLLNRDTVTWNTLIAGYVEGDLNCEALLCLQKMEQEGKHLDESTFVYAIKACTNLRALYEGQKFHLKLIEEGFESDSYVGNTLVDFYGKLGFLVEAEAVNDDLFVQDVVPWTALIAAYVDHGQNKEALENYKHMLELSVFPNEITYACILRSCSNAGDIENIHSVHSIITKFGQEGIYHLGQILVDVYASSGCFIEAHSVFDSLLTHDVVVWTALIGGYVEHGLGDAVVCCLKQMFLDGISPSPVTLIFSLKACSSSGAINTGKQVHMDILKMGYESDLTAGNALLDMYARCGSFIEACSVFDTLQVRNVVTWNILISACTDCGFEEGVVCYMEQMVLEGVLPNLITYSCTLKCCSRLGAIERGRTIHIQAVKEGTDIDYTFGNALLSLYAKCGSLTDARKVLDGMPSRDVVGWTTLVGGYSEHGFGKEALKCLEEMHLEKVPSNSVTLDSSLRACITVPNPINNIRLIHAEILKKGFCLDTCLGDSLVLLYAKHGFLEEGHMLHDDLLIPSSVSSNALIEGYVETGDFAEATRFFNNLQVRDVFSWTVLMSGCVEQDANEQALFYFEQMQQNAVSPDATSFSCGLQACRNLCVSVKGQGLHLQIVKQGFEQDPFLGNCLLDMYAKFGFVNEALDIFKKLVIRDIISWTALATGYALLSLKDEVCVCLSQMQCENVSPNLVFWNSIIGAFAENDDIETASMFMLQMQEQGQLPDSWTITSVLKACGKAADIVAGKSPHAQVAASEVIDSICVAALIDMYSKCGSMANAQQLFDSFPTRNIGPWNALIDGYSRQGTSPHVFSFLESMQAERIQPNETTFLSILMVCGHAGFINMGQTYFEIMCKMWKIEPTIKHFNSMALLFGRAGQLSKTLVMVEKMTYLPDLSTWRSLLAATRLCGDVPVGIHALDAVCDEEHSNSFTYF